MDVLYSSSTTPRPSTQSSSQIVIPLVCNVKESLVGLISDGSTSLICATGKVGVCTGTNLLTTIPVRWMVSIPFPERKEITTTVYRGGVRIMKGKNSGSWGKKERFVRIGVLGPV